MKDISKKAELPQCDKTAVSGSALDLIISRMKYYLIDWKEQNIEDFVEQFGDIKLRDLSKKQLHQLFIYASTRDASGWV